MRELFVSEPGLGPSNVSREPVMRVSWSDPGGHTTQCQEPRDVKIHGERPDTGTNGNWCWNLCPLQEQNDELIIRKTIYNIRPNSVKRTNSIH